MYRSSNKFFAGKILRRINMQAGPWYDVESTLCGTSVQVSRISELNRLYYFLFNSNKAGLFQKRLFPLLIPAIKFQYSLLLYKMLFFKITINYWNNLFIILILMLPVHLWIELKYSHSREYYPNEKPEWITTHVCICEYIYIYIYIYIYFYAHIYEAI